MVEELLTKSLVHSYLPSRDDVLAICKQKKSIHLVYGETYDQFGLTVDSLKYYFFLSLLHDALETSGISVFSSIIVGDVHSILNQGVKDKDVILDRIARQLELMQKIKETYHLRPRFVLMSNLLNSKSFKHNLSIITKQFGQSKEMKELAQKTILQNRITQEEKGGYQYTLEEVSLILDFDIKVGPPREAYFDQIARMVGPSVGNSDFCGIYLNPTYPLGLDFDFFINHPEIEEFGLTPYKAGSNKLQNNRIVLGETSLDDCRQLIRASFVPENKDLPNPIFDLYMLGEMAKSLLFQETFSFKNTTDSEALEKDTYDYLEKYVFAPLQIK